MAESYSVKAILSATDKGFTSTLRNALSSVTGLAKSVGSGMLMGAGMAAFNALSNGARSLVSEINDSNVAWKTFESNMQIIEKSGGTLEQSIGATKEALQDFAQETVYSASDMASTYAQLAAVGTKDTEKLVKGFGGLAAAAENPQQAMKTLSQQATQMAAKTNVAWADFKLMLEQTPAGIAAVAKHMGMSTSEMVTAVQEGKVKTEDFFNAIATVGGDVNGEFYKMATTAKSVGQAMDGLKETIGNKLTPAFDLLSNIGIKAIEGISDKLGKIDGEAIANKLGGWIKKVQPLWNSFTKAASKVWEVLSGVGTKLAPVFDALKTKASGAIQGMLDKIGSIDANAIVDKLCGWAQKAQPYFDLFSSAIQTVSGAISAAIPYIMDFASAIGSYLLDNAETISSVIGKATPVVLGLIGAFKGYKMISSLIPGVSGFTSAIGKLASGGISGLAGKLFGVSTAQKATGEASASSAKQILAAGAAFLMIGASVALIAAGFALLAQSAIALSDAGGLAIGVMAGMAVALVGIGVGAVALLTTLSALGPSVLTAGGAMMMLGAAVVLVGAGFALMAQASIALADAGGLAIGVMVGMVAVFALLAVGAAVLGPALTAGAVGFIAFGAAIALVGAGAVLAAAALAIVSSVLPAIVANGAQGAAAIAQLGAGMIVFAAGAALAGAASVTLGAGLIVVGAGAIAAAAGVVAMAAGVTVLAAGALLLGASLTVCAASVTMMAAVFPAASAGAMLLVATLTSMLGVAAGLGAALLVVNAPLVLIGASALVATAGMAAFGAAMVVAAAGTVAMAAGLKAVQSSMKSIASSAKTAESSLDSMQDSVNVVENGLNALGSKAKDAMSKITNAFNQTASKAQSAGLKVGQGFTKGMQSGLSSAPSVAKQAVSSVAETLRSAHSGAYSAGAYISQGFAQGMLSCLATVQAAAAQLAAAAQKAIEAKAAIASPSKVTTKLGQFFGEGFKNGIEDMKKSVWNTAEDLVSVPKIATPNLAGAFGGEMSAEFDYYRNYEYTIEVPLTVDGKKFAQATATYTQDELNKRQTRDGRKHGRL